MRSMIMVGLATAAAFLSSGGAEDGATSPTRPSYDGTTVAYFHVADLERSLRWYGDVLGFTEVVTRNDAIGWCELQSPTEGLAIGLLQSASVAATGGATLVFGVKDVDATRALLTSRQVRFQGPTEVHPGYVKLASFVDPDGHLLTLSQSLANEAAPAAGDATGGPTGGASK